MYDPPPGVRLIADHVKSVLPLPLAHRLQRAILRERDLESTGDRIEEHRLKVRGWKLHGGDYVGRIVRVHPPLEAELVVRNERHAINVFGEARKEDDRRRWCLGLNDSSSCLEHVGGRREGAGDQWASDDLEAVVMANRFDRASSCAGAELHKQLTGNQTVGAVKNWRDCDEGRRRGAAGGARRVKTRRRR